MRLQKKLVGAAALAVVAALTLASIPSFASPVVMPGDEPGTLPAATPDKDKETGDEKVYKTPEDFGMTAEQWQRQMDQLPLFDLSAKVEEISVADPGNPGAGTEFDTPNKTLIVYWRGEPPAELLALNDSAAEIGYRVEIRPAAFSAIELKTAAKDLADMVGSGTGVLSVGMNYDGSGLTVSYPGLDGLTASPDEAVYDLTDQVQKAIDTMIARGIPVTVEASFTVS